MDKLFTVYDEKAEAYLPPFFVPTMGIATRAFQECINSKSHQFGKHPQDYTLFHLGTFDDESATFDLLTAPKSLGNGVEFIELNPEGDTDGPQSTPILTNEKSGDSS